MTTRQMIERRSALKDSIQQYRRMLEIRYFEDEIVGLFAEGLVHGTTHTCHGNCNGTSS
jgi:TPP-dependent pyruvate/acetoin dehydrogenase alpha subunit